MTAYQPTTLTLAIECPRTLDDLQKWIALVQLLDLPADAVVLLDTVPARRLAVSVDLDSVEDPRFPEDEQ